MNFLRFLKNPLFSLQKFTRTVQKGSFLKSYTQIIDDVRSNDTSSINLDEKFKDTRHLVDSDIDKIKVISIKILSMIDYLSKEHGFNYFMSYGTLIGVIRHQGFIPWDDDIDIMMTQKDLDKFIEVSYKLPDSIKFFPQGLNFLKVMDKYSKMSIDGKRGVAVDIFLLSDKQDQYSFVNVHNQKSIALKESDILPLSWMPFENIEVPVPANYHDILKTIYGDYMKLPPVDQRVSHHVNNSSVHIYPFPIKQEAN